MYDIIVIGAGAAGLTAAITAAKRNKKILVIDKNKKCGAKLYATGNGRCNITNLKMDISKYYNDSFSYDVIGREDASKQVISFFNELGLMTYDRDGYVYPLSNQASSLVWALKDAAEETGLVSFRYNHAVKDISKIIEAKIDETEYKKADESENAKIKESEAKVKYKVFLDNNETYEAEKILIAAGGFSYPKLGTAGNEIYHIFDKLNIKYQKFEPALCPIFTKDDMSGLYGVRSKGRVSVCINFNNKRDIIYEDGEIQFTDYGLSGIVIFNLAYYLKAEDTISLNLIPEISKELFISLFEKNKNRKVLAILNGLLNDKLSNYIINRCFTENEKKFKLTGNNLDRADILRLYDTSTNLKFTVRGKDDFNMSQASVGGILTDQIDKDSMKIISTDGIYCAGEVTNIIAKCGGYNLTYAFLSGIKAGRNM